MNWAGGLLVDEVLTTVLENVSLYGYQQLGPTLHRILINAMVVWKDSTIGCDEMPIPLPEFARDGSGSKCDTGMCRRTQACGDLHRAASAKYLHGMQLRSKSTRMG